MQLNIFPKTFASFINLDARLFGKQQHIIIIVDLASK